MSIDADPNLMQDDAGLRGWRAAVGGGARLVRFFSRLPVPRLSFEAEPHAAPDFRAAPLLLPFAGLIIGLPGALMLGVAASAGLPALMASGLALAVAVFVTGALHEDGLADSFDGLAGGRTPERRLDIMRDSRIGSFGAAALMLALMLRAAGLAGLLPILGPWGAATVMLAAGCASRTISLLPMAALAPARTDGAAATSRPSAAAFLSGFAIAAVVAAALSVIGGAGVLASASGVFVGFALACAMTFWAARAIGGQTGDIAGGCQQLAEIGFYVGVLLVVGGGAR